MKKIKIRYPIWNTRSVGIAKYKITEDIEVEILYKTRTGDRLYPDRYFMYKEMALSYPMKIQKGVGLQIIPIDDFISKNA